MIDEVIICGVRRARQKIQIGQIKQSIGRAGRSYDKSGKAVILCPSQDLEYAESCIYDETPPIKSELNNLESISFHILPWIDRIYDEQSFQRWYERSLASIQGNKFTWNEVSRYLIDNQLMDQEYNITPFGKISVKTYLEPEKLINLRDKLLEANANGNVFEPVTLSYILASEKMSLSNVNAYELYEYKSALSSNGYMFQHGQIIHGYAYYCIFNNTIPRWVKHVVNNLKDDFSRVINALAMVADYENLKDIQKQIKVIEISVTRKVSIELARIIREFNLQKKASAYELKQLGIINKDDLEENEDYLIKHATDQLKKDLQNQGFLKDLLIKQWRGL